MSAVMDDIQKSLMQDVPGIFRFVLAGNSTFTLVSKATGKRFTYKVSRVPDFQLGVKHAWFVNLLTGPNNSDDYIYMGMIRGEPASGDVWFWHSVKSKVALDAPSCKGFMAFFETLTKTESLHPSIEFWHEGRCGRCGRKLTVPESVASGFGPECAGKE